MSATMMKDLPLSKVYQLLEPGPVVLLTTAHKGRANVMTMSWHMMVEFEPPLVACVVSNRDHSFRALRATKECVIAIPAVELAPVVVEIGNCSGRDVEKFESFGLTPVPAERVAPGRGRHDDRERSLVLDIRRELFQQFLVRRGGLNVGLGKILAGVNILRPALFGIVAAELNDHIIAGVE